MPKQPSRPATRKCPVCARKFTPMRADSRYCAAACRQRARRARANVSDIDRQTEAG